jgi:hypothetical protein
MVAVAGGCLPLDFLALAQVASGDLDVAVFGQLPPAELALGNALETRPL